MSLQKRFNSVTNRINHACQSRLDSDSALSQVKLLAVSKKQSLEKIQALYALGQRKFGESYLQEALVKIQKLNDLSIQWHFIGPIQSNKSKHIAANFHWVQSVASLKILQRLNRHRPKEMPPLNVLLQLKVGDEASKKGLSAEQLLELCRQHRDYTHIKIRGLMAIPPPSDEFDVQLFQFQQCHKLYTQMQKIISVDTLSIGMSNDLEAAIAAGSTMVRVGSDLFGARQ